MKQTILTDHRGKPSSSRAVFKSAHSRDVAFQLLRKGMCWDGDLISKTGRDILVEAGYAVRHDGYQALTGRGIVAILVSPTMWLSARKRRRQRIKSSRAFAKEGMT